MADMHAFQTLQTTKGSLQPHYGGRRRLGMCGEPSTLSRRLLNEEKLDILDEKIHSSE
jgi:hypothetical protein